MNNAEWVIANGYKFKDIQIYKNFSDDGSWDYGIDILKMNMSEHLKGKGRTETLLKWLDSEHKEPILDDAEKRYLKAVIRPFRDNVAFICKHYMKIAGHTYHFVFIGFKDCSPDIDLPPFEEGAMYRCMRLGKAYTPEDLGL